MLTVTPARALVAHALGGDLGAQLLGGGLGGRGVGVGQQRQELLSAEAAELVLHPQVQPHHVRDRGEHLVAGRVAVLSLNALKWSTSIIATARGCWWRRAPLTKPAQLGEDEAPVEQARERVLEDHRLQPARPAPTSSCWSPLVRPAARTRATSSASPAGSTRKSWTPRSERADGEGQVRARLLDEHDRRAVGVGVALEVPRQAFAPRQRLVEHDVGRPSRQRVERLLGLPRLGDLVAGLLEYAGEPLARLWRTQWATTTFIITLPLPLNVVQDSA